MTNLRSIFLRGLFTFLPLLITVYVLFAGAQMVENLLGGTIQSLAPQAYIPGVGFVVIIVLIFLLGLMLNSLILGGLFRRIEDRLMTVPLFNTVYSPLRDLMKLFSKKGQSDLKAVVLVELGNGIQAIGLVTRESFRDLPTLSQMTDGKITVYIPWSYGLGGLTFLVPKSKVTPVDIPVERAMSLALTAWVKTVEETHHE
jgi:uncharacterized membrane protein